MTKVKICGLSTVAAVETAVAAGADYIGFVFAKSPRQVSIEQAAQLAQQIPASVQKVGVFVSPSLAELEQAIVQVGLGLLQIHGEFDEGLLSQISVPVIRAVQVTAGADLAKTQADYLLFDAPVAGSGQTFDWKQLDSSAISQPFFIAGGLDVENVTQAIQTFQPYAVDVSSGVETDGVKDHEKIRRFIERVKDGL